MGIFNPWNGIYRYTEKLVDLILLSIFWVACSLPLVTLGPATAALYNTVVRCIRHNERNSWGMFFTTFKNNLKVGVLTSLVVIPVAVILIFLYDLLYQSAQLNSTGYVLFYAYQIFLLLPVGAACYLFPVLSRFTFQVGGLIGTCAKLAIAHLPSTILLAVIFFAAVTLCSNLILFLFLLPTIVALLHSFLLERIFKPYIDAQRGTPEEEE